MQHIFKAKSQEEFLVAAYKFHKGKNFGERYYFYCGPYWATVDWLFKLGKDYQILNTDYEQFVRILNNKEIGYYDGRYYIHRRYYRRRIGRYYSPETYRVLKGFTYNGQAKKDSPTKNAWKEHKKTNRDKRKGRHYGSWKKNLKHFGKRKHRQLERKAIRHEEYDRLHRLSYKQAENPWSWD